VDAESTEEQQALQDITRKFLEREAPLTAIRQRPESGRAFTPDFWKRAAGLGWTSLLLPEPYGGYASASPVLDLLVVSEEVGRVVGPGPLVPCNVVIEAIARCGSDDIRDNELPSLVDGSRTAAWAFGEDGDCWSQTGMRARAERRGSDYCLRGTKVAVENADIADTFLVSVGMDDGPAQFLVPRDTPGLEVTTVTALDLTRRFGRVVLDDVVVPGSAQLVPDGKNGSQIDRQLILAVALQLADVAGMVDTVFASTVDYLQDRYAFGRPLASYQALKHRLADHKVTLEAILGVSTAVGRSLGADGGDEQVTASVGKAFVGDASLEILSDCAQLFGGIAMTWEHELHFFLRRATVNRVLYGSPSQHREILCDLAGIARGH
jgi:alkylation response protein AidB-like acyl-CoA dehydrogenase